ncbi:MAG: TIGR02452 family protein [Verrucomicrobia bacterium]|nr:TIGR02452 family protein [Verrucomicrobiota bacterium]
MSVFNKTGKLSSEENYNRFFQTFSRDTYTKTATSTQLVLETSHFIDELGWVIEENSQNGTISQDLQKKIIDGITAAGKNLVFLRQVVDQHVRPDYLGATLDEGDAMFDGLKHAEKKHEMLVRKFTSLTPVGNVISHQQFSKHAQFPTTTLSPIQLPSSTVIQTGPFLAQRKVVSFKVEPATGSTEVRAASSPSVLLSRISFLLRHNNEPQALQEFEQLPPDIQKSVYLGMWIVRGRPMPGNPIAHDNFGEVSFKNQEPRCASSPQQKACAVELIKTQVAMMEMMQLFARKDMAAAKAVFESLPQQVQNEIYGKHWEVCGKPTDKSPEESLRKIAHSDFGKVSFLGLDPRCDVPMEKRIETITICMSEFKKKSEAAQTATAQTAADWTNIDFNGSLKGPQKNDHKCQSLLGLAKAIVPLFMGNIAIEAPQIQEKSYKALAAAYVQKYPCLKPYMLQLVNDLRFANEALPVAQESRKSSQAANPNLGAMSDEQRKQYRTSIMAETFSTLQNGFYINSKGEKVTLDLQPAVQSLKLEKDSGKGTVRQGKYNTQLFLDKKDCLTVTRDLAERGLNPIVLDAASDGHFGGGYKKGAGAQEENMCRRSGLCISADPTLEVQKNNFYPLSGNGEHAGLYVDRVPVFRGEEEEGYPYLDKPFETAVSIMAAYNFNESHQRKNKVPEKDILRLVSDLQTGELRIPEPQASEMKEKMRTVLHMAEKNGHESVVLMPLGCGAFCNPPKHVSEMMMELITEEFPHSFKEVHISIIDDHNTGQAHNPRGNFTEFKDTIEKGFLGKLQGISATFQVS